MRRAFFRAPFLAPSPCGVSSAVLKRLLRYHECCRTIPSPQLGSETTKAHGHLTCRFVLTAPSPCKPAATALAHRRRNLVRIDDKEKGSDRYEQMFDLRKGLFKVRKSGANIRLTLSPRYISSDGKIKTRRSDLYLGAGGCQKAIHVEGQTALRYHQSLAVPAN